MVNNDTEDYIEVSLLVLDAPDRYDLTKCERQLGSLLGKKVTILVTSEAREGSFSRNYLYSNSEWSLKQAREAMRYSAVIIGNNLGFGLRKAGKIPEDGQDITIITFGVLQPCDTARYTKIPGSPGFTHFCERADTAALVAFLMTIIRPQAA